MSDITSEKKNRYNHSKIYKMVERTTNYFYIGSTTSKLSKRFHEHKEDAKRQPERHVYKYLNSIGWDNVEIVLIEEHSLNSKEQLKREEDKIIQQHLNTELCLNSFRAFQSQEEKKTFWKNWHQQDYAEKKELYRKKHADYRHEHLVEEKVRRKKYREENKELIREKSQEYYQNNYKLILQKQKEYREANKEKIRNREKTFYEQNKERIEEKLKEMYTCSCGASLQSGSKLKHEKSKKHTKFISTA